MVLNGLLIVACIRLVSSTNKTNRIRTIQQHTKNCWFESSALEGANAEPPVFETNWKDHAAAEGVVTSSEHLVQVSVKWLSDRKSDIVNIAANMAIIQFLQNCILLCYSYVLNFNTTMIFICIIHFWIIFCLFF